MDLSSTPIQDFLRQVGQDYGAELQEVCQGVIARLPNDQAFRAPDVFLAAKAELGYEGTLELGVLATTSFEGPDPGEVECGLQHLLSRNTGLHQCIFPILDRVSSSTK